MPRASWNRGALVGICHQPNKMYPAVHTGDKKCRGTKKGVLLECLIALGCLRESECSSGICHQPEIHHAHRQQVSVGMNKG